MDLGPLQITALAGGDKKLRHALFEPSAVAIGKLASAWVEHLSAPLYPPRRANFQRHTAHAAERLGVEGLEVVCEQAAFVEWAEGVSMIEPEDEELASIWQAALAAMRDGGHERLALLDIAKRMRPDEAKAFQRLARERYRPDRGFPAPPAPLWRWLCDSLRSEGRRRGALEEEAHLSRFVALGLGQSLSVRLRASGGIKLAATLAVALSGAWGLTFAPWWSSQAAPTADLIRAYIGIATMICTFGAVLSAIRKWVNQPELTPRGVALAYRILDLCAPPASSVGKPDRRKRRRKTNAAD